MKKIFLIALIMGSVILSYIFMTAAMPFFVEMSSYAANVSDNYSAYKAAMQGVPLWLYFIPAVVGIVGIIMVLRSK